MSVVLAIQSTNHIFGFRVRAQLALFSSCMHVLGTLVAMTKSDLGTNHQAQDP